MISSINFIDSILIKKGVKFRGDSAHYELIEASKKENILSEQETSFIQQLRTLRNQIQYEGFTIKENFITRNHRKLTSITKKLELTFHNT
jgi:hypothetical protein